MSPYSAMGVVGELGYLIAIPAFLFGFGGAYLDKYFGTSPWLLLSGFLLAFLVSGLSVWRMVQRILPPEPEQKATKSDQ